MATTYTINVTSATFLPGPADPQVTIIATVSAATIQTVTVQTTAWLSALQQAKTAGGNAAVIALISPDIIAAALAAQPPAASSTDTAPDWSVPVHAVKRRNHKCRTRN